MAKHFGYMVPTLRETVDVVVGPPATDATLAEYATLTKVITMLQPLVIAMTICEQECAALVALPAQRAAMLSASTVPTMPSTVVFDFLVAATRAVTANLAAASAFLKQSECMVARLFGEGSPRDLAWNDQRRALHTGSVGYRIMYDLWNYAQHYGLPVSKVSVQGQRAGDTAPMTFSLSIGLIRDDLLSSAFNWSAQRRVDLNGLPAEFEVLPLAVDYLHCQRTLLLSIVREFGEELSTCRHYLETVRRILEVPAGGRVYLFDVPDSAGEPGAPPSLRTPPGGGEIVPEDQFAWLLTQLSAVVLAPVATAPIS